MASLGLEYSHFRQFKTPSGSAIWRSVEEGRLGTSSASTCGPWAPEPLGFGSHLELSKGHVNCNEMALRRMKCGRAKLLLIVLLICLMLATFLLTKSTQSYTEMQMAQTSLGDSIGHSLSAPRAQPRDREMKQRRGMYCRLLGYSSFIGFFLKWKPSYLHVCLCRLYLQQYLIYGTWM